MDDKLTQLTKCFFKILHISVKEQTITGLVQFIKFGLIGATNTIISYVLNILVLLFMEPFAVSWDFIAGNIVAFVLSVLWSFYWNNKLVFTVKKGESRSIFKTLIKTYLAYGFTGIILNNVLSWIWINALSVSKYVAPLINLVISVPLNFVINKKWAFKN